MSLKPYYFILFVIFLSSSASALLLLYYLNPELDPGLALSLMGFALFLAGSSFLSLFLFFVKKIYYRGDVYLSTMSASIRQAILLTIGSLVMGIFWSLGLMERNLVLMVWASLIILEIIMQVIE